jgi:hypothetical protein
MWQGKGVSPVSFGADVARQGVSPASRGADEARQGGEPGWMEPVAAAYRLQAVAKPSWALNGAKEGADRGESHSSSLGTALQPYLCT